VVSNLSCASDPLCLPLLCEALGSSGGFWEALGGTSGHGALSPRCRGVCCCTDPSALPGHAASAPSTLPPGRPWLSLNLSCYFSAPTFAFLSNPTSQTLLDTSFRFPAGFLST
uniref:Uncharacterized protein n=1 Tax=Athene cunicularia TaxID=194338 RepID=A0A663M9A6_ATHCN